MGVTRLRRVTTELFVSAVLVALAGPLACGARAADMFGPLQGASPPQRAKLRHRILSYMFPASADSATALLAPGQRVVRVTITATGTDGVVGHPVKAKARHHRRRRHGGRR